MSQLNMLASSKARSLGLVPSDIKPRNPRHGVFADDVYRLTTITELADTGKDISKLDWEHPTLLLLMGVNYKNAKVAEQGMSYYTRGKRTEGSVNYERLMHTYDPLAEDGENAVAILTGRGHNTNFYSKSLHERDTTTYSKLIFIVDS